MYAGGATGFAELRRDGFASMHADTTASLTTRTLRTSGKYLFINASATELRAEILNPSGQVLADCSAEDSLEFTGDSCCARLRWRRRETTVRKCRG